MKRILVIDESEVIRDTLALILGRDFLVVKKALARGELSLYDAPHEIDLMILGVAPILRSETSRLLTFATQAPFAVLLLVDSKSTAKAIEDREQIGCLAKPFNPYELKEKVGQLLARRPVLPEPPEHESKHPVRTEYLEYPYLARAAASLIHRFADTHFPVLIAGEIGCGQDRVARAVYALRGETGPPIAVDGAAVNPHYLSEKRLEVLRRRGLQQRQPVMLVENTDRLNPFDQSLLLTFLEQVEHDGGGRRQLVATAKVDLLEKVYRGEFLESLYARLATLSLRLAPLRERREDLPVLAECVAQEYSRELGLGPIQFADTAIERLQNYLWFGNLTELEMVIARTLAARRATRLEAADLIFDFTDVETEPRPAEERPAPGPEPRRELRLVSAHPNTHSGLSGAQGNGHIQRIDLSILIHELAHELKNPMVTIKTFAQLLSERYQDEDFRTRFEGVVSTDIERMDDLLESLVEFADFMQPQTRVLPLDDSLIAVLAEMSGDCAKRQVQVRWKDSGSKCVVRADEAQVKFVLRNILIAVLSQIKPGSEIEVHVEKNGSLSLTYVREMGRMAAISQYFNNSAPNSTQDILPLRVLLAKHLIERNHGRIVIEDAEDDKAVVTIEFPT
jgi:two-component system response regulator PilR (NtrC family)